MHDPLDDPDRGDADDPSDRGAPPDRTWRHPSEVGLDQRGRVDRRRSTALAAGLVVAGVALLGVGALLGMAGAGDPTVADATSSPREVIEPSVATVATDGAAGRRTSTAIVLDRDGRLVVRADAVDGADEVWVTCGDRAPQRAEVLAVDAGRGLAVVQVADAAGRPVLHQDRPRTGADLLAVRSPGGERSVEVGAARVEDDGDGTAATGTPTFRAVAQLAHAEGALFDRRGRLVGLVVGGGPADDPSSGAMEVTAIPAGTVVDVGRRLAESSGPAAGWIGVAGEDVGNGRGVRLTDVVPGGPAAVADLRVGDVVVGVGEDDVDSMDDLAAVVHRSTPGTEVTVVLRRDGTESRTELTTATRPTS